jgi:hypothetical protein
MTGLPMATVAGDGGEATELGRRMVALTATTRIMAVRQGRMVVRRSALIIRRPLHTRCHQFQVAPAEAAVEGRVAVIRAAAATDLNQVAGGSQRTWAALCEKVSVTSPRFP